MTKILQAKPLVEKMLPSLQERCSLLIKKGVTPFMRVILVGNNPASLLYIKNKKKLCLKIGAKFELIQLPKSASQAEFLATIERYNQDSLTTGLFIQLPLPPHLQALNIYSLISPHKDVDGFHPSNIFNIYRGNQEGLQPCTPKGIVKLFNFYGITLAGKNIVVIGRSLIVGRPLCLLLTNHHATVTNCHSQTKDLKQHTRQADVIVSATGQARFINKDYLSPKGNQILIDIGINHDEQAKLCGDFAFDQVRENCRAITPVPGGTGPLTVLSLMENLLNATEKIIERDKKGDRHGK